MRPQPGDKVSAGGDVAFRKDNSALVIVYRRGPLFIVAEILELRPEPGKPLKPSETVKTFAERMAIHGCSYLVADNHYRETIDEHLQQYGLVYAPAPAQPAVAFMRARALFRQGVVRIPNNARLLQQLKDVQGRPLPGGGMSISQPRNAFGHGDIVSALVLALHNLGGDEVPQAKAPMGSQAWEEAQRAMRRKAAELAAQDLPWWKKRGTQRR